MKLPTIQPYAQQPVLSVSLRQKWTEAGSAALLDKSLDTLTELYEAMRSGETKAECVDRNAPNYSAEVDKAMRHGILSSGKSKPAVDAALASWDLIRR